MRIFASDTEVIAVAAAIGNTQASTTSRIKFPLSKGDYKILYAAGSAQDNDGLGHLTLLAGTDLVLWLNYWDANDTWLNSLTLGVAHFDATGNMPSGLGCNVVAPFAPSSFFCSEASGYPITAASFSIDISAIVHNDVAAGHSVALLWQAVIEQSGLGHHNRPIQNVRIVA